MSMTQPVRAPRYHQRRAPTLPPLLRVTAALLLCLTWLGCAKDDPNVTEPTSQSLAALRTITGRILGPDGRNICRTIQQGTEDVMLVELLNPDFNGGNEPFLGLQEVTCPDNSYSLEQDAAHAFLRVELPINEKIDRLPWRNLEELTVPAGGLSHTVHIVEGAALNGKATLDGEPLEGIPLNISYAFNGGFGATFTTSGPNGRWVEFFGRTPPILRNDIDYLAFCNLVLGAFFPAFIGEFLFPQRHGVSCPYATAPTNRFSHTATRLKVTPMPGDIGGSFSGELFGQYGVGLGVQFPVSSGESPIRPDFFSEFFNGGLIIGVPAQGGRPARTLLGADGAGEFVCGDPCRDLGLDGDVTFSPTGASGERKSVTWRYSDAGSDTPVGLEMIQHSIDGTPPNDYVLFRFRIRNTSPSALTLYAGFFGDVDSEFDAGDDRGATALNGRLMYQVSENESGIYTGTVLLGDAPVTGNYFFNFEEDPLSVPDQIRALRGNIRRTTAGPTDLRYIHGAGPIKLDRHEAKDLWLAVVAGENRSQLIANANAARDKVNRLLNTAISDASETIRMTTVPSRVGSNRLTPCKKNCRPR
jgi:hypothetical protein